MCSCCNETDNEDAGDSVWGGGGVRGPLSDCGSSCRQGEEGIRKAVWEKNMRMIEAHNQEAALGMQSFEMAMNHLGDMVSAGSPVDCEV